MRWILMGVLFACACGPGERVTGQELCDRWSTAYCARASDCGPSDVGMCTANIEAACCEQFACETGDESNVSDDRLDDCESAINDAECEDELPVVPDVCMFD